MHAFVNVCTLSYLLVLIYLFQSMSVFCATSVSPDFVSVHVECGNDTSDPMSITYVGTAMHVYSTTSNSPDACLAIHQPPVTYLIENAKIPGCGLQVNITFVLCQISDVVKTIKS